MTAVPIYFDEFLTNIRPQPAQRTHYAKAHQLLRQRLQGDQALKAEIVTTFLQGSYRRATLLRPAAGKQADVDVVVLTRFDHNNSTPEAVLNQFEVFARRAYEATGEGTVKRQGRSVGIVLPEVALDIVPTAAASEAQTIAVDPFVKSDSALDEDGTEPLRKSAADEAWRKEPLRIPDRDAKVWEYTNPLQQIAWTTGKNAESNGLFINVVKIFKHWRRHALTALDRPKGFPLERVVGDCFVTSTSVADGITNVFAQFIARYEANVKRGGVPRLTDYGVPSRDVMARVDPRDFAKLYAAVAGAEEDARVALACGNTNESIDRWRALFGDDFPPPNTDDGGRGGGFTPRSNPSRPSNTGRFA
ncbi:MAG: nucleotidyltransferase [Deltaproteobacteria bacterium]|nr:nucleotidyltransferase [Deltaproteobacteria bacterium]